MKSEADMTEAERRQKWDAEDAAHTLERIEEINADKKLLSAAKKLLQDRKQKIDMILSKLK